MNRFTIICSADSYIFRPTNSAAISSMFSYYQILPIFLSASISFCSISSIILSPLIIPLIRLCLPSLLTFLLPAPASSFYHPFFLFSCLVRINTDCKDFLRCSHSSMHTSPHSLTHSPRHTLLPLSSNYHCSLSVHYVPPLRAHLVFIIYLPFFPALRGCSLHHNPMIEITIKQKEINFSW